MNEKFLDKVDGATPEGWELGDVIIHIKRPKEKRIQVEAWRRGPFALHERKFPGGREIVLTHAPTGLRIYGFGSLERAIELAERIEPLTNWMTITEKLPAGSDLYSKVSEIVDEIVDDIIWR